MQLINKTILITEGASAIGRERVNLLATQNTLLLAGRNQAILLQQQTVQGNQNTSIDTVHKVLQAR